MFSPVDVLDSCLKSAGGASPQKWEPRSIMGVYLGHSPFHASSVALVFNPLTGWVTPQYHVVYDGKFSTVAYMEEGAVPPNWPALVKYSSEWATNEDFILAETWSTSDSDAISDPVNDKFSVVVPDQSNETSPEKSQVIPCLYPYTIVISVSEGDQSPTSGAKRKSSAVRSCEKVMKSSTGGRVGSYQEKRRSISTTKQMPVTTSVDELRMPPRLNLYESGLRRLARIHELDQQEKYSKRKKAHVTYCAATTRALFGLNTLFCFTSRFNVPHHT